MKKKVLFFANGLYGGGAERVLQTILKNLSTNQYDITLYSLRKEKITGEYPSAIHYNFIFDNISFSKNFLDSLLFKIKNKIKLFIYYHFSPKLFYCLFVKGKYDTEIAFIEGYATRIISGSTNKKSKKIAWVHIDLEHFHWTKNVYKDLDEETEAYKRYSEIVTVSNTAEAAFKRVFKIGMPRVQTLYNPVDIDEIIRQSEEEKALMPKHCIRLVSIGRLTRQKAYDRLLHIALKLKTEGYSFELWILGDGKQRDSLDVFVKENGLADVVKMLGFKPNPYVYLKQCDLFVCSSLSEGYSTAVTEALILGLPVVTTDCSGMRELLQEGTCGIITDNNEKALYYGIKQMLGNESLFEQYKQKAIERGKDFTLQTLMKPIEKLLSE